MRSVGGGLWKQIVREGRRLWEGGRRSEDVEVREEVGVRRWEVGKEEVGVTGSTGLRSASATPTLLLCG